MCLGLSERDYTEVVKLLTDNKICITNLEKTVALSILAHEKDSDRYYKIIIALIAMVGGILGLKLFPSSTTTTVIHLAFSPVASTIDWGTTLSNFTRYYTVFALIFTGGSIIREYWKNGYNKYLGGGMIIMSISILLQIFDVFENLAVNALWLRLIYNTMFLMYAYNLGLRKIVIEVEE